MEIVGLLGAKKESQRLPGKGWRDFNGKPMFVWNTEKGLSLCDRMYVSSDYDYILDIADDMGAIPIKRTGKLMECPNITWYRYCMQFMNGCDILIALQVNSPTINSKIIKEIKDLMTTGKYQEIKTCHKDGSDYGSVWAMTKDRLDNYGDPYHAKPDLWIEDRSIDIHTQNDLAFALIQVKI